jgi:hypothetical protein
MSALRVMPGFYFFQGRGKDEEITGTGIVFGFAWFHSFVRRGEGKCGLSLSGGRGRNKCGATTVAKSRQVEQAS